MSKYGATKERILELVAQGNNNLSKISSELELSPSTVSKHLHDLEKEGRIEKQDNAHFRKWKFYSVGSARKREQYPGQRDRGIGKGTIIAIAAFLLLTVSAAAYAYSGSSSNSQIQIRITDPPKVPAGTQALYINYSSLEAETGSGSNFTWVTVNSSGRLDLVSLINYTQLIGELNIKPGTTISRMAFNITSASITIDNVTYAVHPLGRQVTADVENCNALNRSSGVLLDFAPIVTPEYTQNSTTFTMLPFLRAIVAQTPNGQGAPMNGRFQGQYPLDPHYRSMFSGMDPNLTVTNVTLLSEGNETTLSITVRNAGIGSVGIMGVFVPYDNMPMFLGNRSTMPRTEEGARQINCSAYLGGPEGAMTARWCQQSNSSVVINESAVLGIMPYLGNVSMDVGLHGPVNRIVISGLNVLPNLNSEYMVAPDMNGQPQPDPEFMLAHPPAINFFVDENGTLVAPMPPMGIHISASEYRLNADSSATLTYRGVLGEDVNMLNGGTHGISIVTDKGIIQANITVG